MHAGNKKEGRGARASTDSAAGALTGIPAIQSNKAADASLSAAFRNALGGTVAEAHLPVPSLKAGQALAKQAKAGKSGPTRGTPRKTHIGPRSGHK